MRLPFQEITSYTDATHNFEAIQGLITSAQDAGALLMPPPNGTDDTATIQGLVNALPQTGNSETSGGTIIFRPNRTYTLKSTINCDKTDNVRLMSLGGILGGAALVADFSAGSTDAMISARSSNGFEIHGGFGLVNNDATYAGTVVDLSTIPALINSQNTVNAHISTSRIDLPSNGTITAVGIRLTNAQTCVISRMITTGGADGIRGTDTAADFCNSITVKDRCYFGGQSNAAIHNPCQAWTVNGCVFEPMLNGHAGALYVDGATAPIQGLNYTGNSHQDADNLPAGGTNGQWVTVHGHGMLIAGNYFQSGWEDVLVSAFSDGVSITGNYVNSVGNAAWDLGAGSPTRVFIAGNGYDGGVPSIVVGAAGAHSSILD